MVDPLNTTPYCGPIEGRKEYSIATAISDGYLPPVEIRFEDKYESYYVVFTFNGKSMAETQESNFFIVIDNKDSDYRIFQGLRWYFPDEDDSDI